MREWTYVKIKNVIKKGDVNPEVVKTVKTLRNKLKTGDVVGFFYLYLLCNN